ncbi:MAG: hypothetical protein HY921_03515 [Elusimicrobia bacterium]|nr:hypothetical protein [Elusimicrobiota bacterium]
MKKIILTAMAAALPWSAHAQDLNVGGAKAAVDKAKAMSIESCNDPEAFSNAGVPVVSDFGSKRWHYWVNNEGMTYFCLYGDGYFAAPGYLADIQDTQDELRITMVSVENPTAGVMRIGRDSIMEGFTVFARKGMPDVYLRVTAISKYRLPKKALREKTGLTHAITLGQVAWLVQEYDKRMPKQMDELGVYMDMDAKARLSSALDIAAKQEGGLFSGKLNERNRLKLLKFLTLRLASDQGLIKEDARPNARIILRMDDPSRDGQEVAVYFSRDGKRTSLRWLAPPGGKPHLEDI